MTQRPLTDAERLAAGLTPLGSFLRVTAKDLRPGDCCCGSKQTVIRILHHAAHIPNGKVEVELETWKGRRRVALWNRSTRIGISRRARMAT